MSNEKWVYFDYTCRSCCDEVKGSSPFQFQNLTSTEEGDAVYGEI